jgi:thiamine-phosphate pyrophosphorylase
MTGDERRARLVDSVLYLVCDAAFEGIAEAVEGGVDMVQLRERSLLDGALLRAARRAREEAHAGGALFLVNDRPDIALLSGADGVHLGEDDLAPELVRTLVGPDLLIGLSTHAPDEITGAGAVDYIGVGPVYETPSKPGRTAVGLALVRYAARHAQTPWFAIGGIDESLAPGVVDAGARRLAVVRAITLSGDPKAAAQGLRAALDGA